MSDVLQMISMVTVFCCFSMIFCGALYLFVVLPCIHRIADKTNWNNGICAENGMRWILDGHSGMDRRYAAGTYRIWILTNVDYLKKWNVEDE